jgi:hypothetical protein
MPIAPRVVRRRRDLVTPQARGDRRQLPGRGRRVEEGLELALQIRRRARGARRARRVPPVACRPRPEKRRHLRGVLLWTADGTPLRQRRVERGHVPQPHRLTVRLQPHER